LISFSINRFWAKVGVLLKNGKMEDWKDGKMEGWKIGKMEGWKIGRFYHRDTENTEKREWKNGILTY